MCYRCPSTYSKCQTFYVLDVLRFSFSRPLFENWLLDYKVILLINYVALLQEPMCDDILILIDQCLFNILYFLINCC